MADLLLGRSSAPNLNPPAHDSTWGFFSDIADPLAGRADQRRGLRATRRRWRSPPRRSPPECASLRASIVSLQTRIATLNDALTGDPHTDATKRKQILQLQQQLTPKLARATALGCVLP